MTVLECLPKQTELVKDSIPNGRQVEGGQRIQKTGGQSSKATIAQPHFRFLLVEQDGVKAESGKGGLQFFVNPGIVNIIIKQAPHKIFEAEVVHAPGIVVIVSFLGAHVTGEQLVAHGMADREPPVPRGRSFLVPGKGEVEVAEN